MLLFPIHVTEGCKWTRRGLCASVSVGATLKMLWSQDNQVSLTEKEDSPTKSMWSWSSKSLMSSSKANLACPHSHMDSMPVQEYEFRPWLLWGFRQEDEVLVGTRNKVFNPDGRCLSVLLDPRLSGCMNHTIDPKLKQADFICRATSGFRSCKVASFIFVACDHANLKTDTLPRHTCKNFSADSLQLRRERHTNTHGT